jgi:hypothetical protein
VCRLVVCNITEEVIPEWHEQRGASQEGPLRYTHDGPVEAWQQPRASSTPNHGYNSYNTNTNNELRHRSRSRSVSRASAPIGHRTPSGTSSSSSMSRSASRTLPNNMTPSRFAQYKLMNEKMGEDRAARFTVNGVGDYISMSILSLYNS